MVPTSSASPRKPGHALLAPGELQLPLALFGDATRRHDAARFVNAGEWIRQRRLNLGMTQKAAAAHLGIPLRQLLSYEATARWPAEAREFVRRHSPKIGVGLLVRRCANRRWASKATLLAELQRIVDGKAPRRRRTKEQRADDADLRDLEDRIRDRLSLKVELLGDSHKGVLQISYSSLEHLEGILSVLGA